MEGFAPGKGSPRGGAGRNRGGWVQGGTGAGGAGRDREGCRAGPGGCPAALCRPGAGTTPGAARSLGSPERDQDARRRTAAAAPEQPSLRRAAVQRGGGHGWRRDLHPARLHLLLAGRLPGEEERGRRGEHGRGARCPSPEPAAQAHPGPCPGPTLVSAAPQLPVVSVVRDAESQLLPDVGAVVTCKVGPRSALRWRTAQPLLSASRQPLLLRRHGVG